MQLMNSVKGMRKSKGNVKFLSPRFLSLFPDKLTSADEQLSPNVLSFYKDNRSIAALPEVLSSIGMTEFDRDSVLSMLMDVSGTTKRVNSALEILKDLNFFDAENEIMNVTEKIVSSFDRLNKTLNIFQTDQMNKKGFAFLEKDQMERFYKDQGIDQKLNLADFEDFFNYNHVERELSLWSTVENIAMDIKEHKSSRQKRGTVLIAGIPVTFFQPAVLAPFAFAPGFWPSVAGPLVLSPNIFSPVILGPSILGPMILSPGVARPFIISPYILGSFIGSPFVMIPFIINPWAFGPNILNPFVLSPVILSPTLFSPDILAPAILGGGILSPSAGSPAVFTESALMISVLSPTFLS
uniref:Uncharacterized protein n=1 Tax=Acrobeloides nanus TaxID=290746 RepID=A0A914E141_9BILA